MKMGKFGQARQADLTQLVALFNKIANTDGDGAPFEVGILNRPSATQIDIDAVARLTALDRFASPLPDRDIRLAVADTDHLARRGGDHVNARLHHGHGRNAKICAAMSVIAQTSTCIVYAARAGIMIEIILDETIAAHFATHRNAKFDLR